MHLRPIHTSIMDIFKVFEPLVCCLKAIWVHPYAITPAKLAPDLGILGCLWSENDVITSWFRLISTSDRFPNTQQTYTNCLSHWYAVSKPTLVLCYRPSWPQIWGFRFTAISWLKLISNSYSDHFKHLYQTYHTSCLSHWHAVTRPYGCTLMLFAVTPAKLAPDLGILGRLLCGNDVTMSWLRLMSTSVCFPPAHSMYTKCV